MITPESVTLETITAVYKRIDRFRDAADAAARLCAQSMLKNDMDAAHRFAVRHRNHLASAEALRDEVLAAAAKKFGTRP